VCGRVCVCVWKGVCERVCLKEWACGCDLYLGVAGVR
jgi:hypothetical protein